MATFLTFAKTWWPIASMILSLLSGVHAASSRAAASDGSASVSQQLTHVVGAGALSGVAMLAGVAGVASNHKAASSAPSIAPVGVSQVAHQLDVLHSAMTADSETTAAELDILNSLVKGRLKNPLTPPAGVK